MVKDGQQYMQTWPMQPQLFGMFPENKVILATKLSIKVMPALAVLTVAALINLQGVERLPQALAIGAFFFITAHARFDVARASFKSKFTTRFKTMVLRYPLQNANARLCIATSQS
jgi:uncharacterized membrane protein YfbV (UPF0208 family)